MGLRVWGILGLGFRHYTPKKRTSKGQENGNWVCMFKRVGIRVWGFCT